MKKIFLTIATFLISSYAFSCSCQKSSCSHFLNQVKKFDAIIEGKFYRDSITNHGYFIADKVYKGAISGNILNIYEGLTDCTEAFNEDFKENYIVGLYKVPDSDISNYYLAPSCVTSILTIKESIVFSENNYHIESKISFFKNRMRKDRLVKKINNRL